MVRSLLLSIILCLSCVSASNEDFSFLFDKDMETVWQSSDQSPTLVIEAPACFDTIAFMSTGDPKRSVGAVIIQEKADDSPSGWRTIHHQAFDCAQVYVAQQIHLDEEYCPSTLKLRLRSCSQENIEIRELQIGHGIHETGKRAAQQVACTTATQCASIFVGLIDCITGFCAKPACLLDADCSNPMAPVCLYLQNAAGSSACGTGCNNGFGNGNNFRCTHIDRYPVCDTGTGMCDVVDGVNCQANGDCTNANFPVCNEMTNLCITCTSHSHCWKFANKKRCNNLAGGQCVAADCVVDSDCVTPYTGPASICDLTKLTCTAPCMDDTDCSIFIDAKECVAGACVIPACWYNYDCTSKATSQCVTDPVAANKCALCTTNDQCAQFFPNHFCSATGCQAFPFGGGPECFDDSDCSDPMTPVCTMGACAAGCDNTKPGVCSQFNVENWCNGGVCTAGCLEREDCTSPTAPICDLTSGMCVAGCTSHDDCAHFFSEVLCVGGAGTATCQKPTCLTDEDCMTTAALFCQFDPATPAPLAAVPGCMNANCNTNDDCAKFFDTYFCGGATGAKTCQAPNCRLDSDCMMPLLSHCTFPLPATPTGVPDCVVCTASYQCNQFYQEKFCQVTPSSLGCVAPNCFHNEDCTPGDFATPVCTWPNPAPTTNIPDCVAGCTTNFDCTKFLSNMPQYHNLWCNLLPDAMVGICTNPECLTNADCTDPTKPVCLFPGDTLLAPTPCVTDADCVATAPLIHCVSAFCSSVRPICYPACQSHADCIQFAHYLPDSTGVATSYCVTLETDPAFGTCINPECIRHQDCLSPTAPYCDVPTDGGPPSCVASCFLYKASPPNGVIHDICAKFGQFFRDPPIAPNNYGHVWCDVNTGECDIPVCLTDTDCKSFSVPFCDLTQVPPTCTVLPPCGTDPTACFQFYRNTWCSVSPASLNTCIVPVCTLNEHCKSPLLPTCNLQPTPTSDPACTAQCLSNDDCTQFVHEWFCVTDATATATFGTCIDACRSNFDCLDPTKPVCVYAPAGPTCKASCVTNEDCAQFVIEWWCSATPDAAAGQCIVPVCTPGEWQCTTPTTPACKVTAGIPACVTGCTMDNDCSRFSAETYCDTDAGICYDPLALVNGCRKNVNCRNPLLPVCIRNPSGLSTCRAGCLTNDDCSHFDFISTPYCAATGECVAIANGIVTVDCRRDTDCLNPLKPVCDLTTDPSRPACAALCTQHDQCAHYAAQTWCLSELGICIIPDCLQDYHCKLRTNAVCDVPVVITATLDRPKCVACTTHDQCAHFGYDSFCDTAGVCISPVCDEAEDCTDPLLPVCSRLWGQDPSSNVRNCQAGCTTHDECDKFYLESWCKDLAVPNAGTCIVPACKTNRDCHDAANPICDLTGNVPVCSPECASNNDCERFWLEQWCVVAVGSKNLGSCLTPGCLDDGDCTDPTKPKCVLPDAVNNWDVPTCNASCTSNDDCAQYTEPVNPRYTHRWCVKSSTSNLQGQCIQPQCWRNTDCTDPAYPVCDNVKSDPPQCISACASNDDCAKFRQETWCIRAAGNTLVGRCVIPACTHIHDCHDPNFPVCDTVNVDPPQCVANCLTDDQCTHFGNNVRCVSGACIVPECFMDSHCTSDITLPACYVPSGTALHPYGWCVQCLTDAHCLLRGTAGEDVTACDVSSHTCVQCVGNDDCAMSKSGLHACAVHRQICVECVNDVDCQAGPTGDRKTCDTSTNTCVRCIIDSDCGVNHPACLTEDATCVDCTKDYHCAAGMHCLVESHTCVACLRARDCASGTCDTSRNVCVGCLIDTDCQNAALPACQVSTQTCVACTRSSQCADPTPACNTATNLCVECTEDSNCPGSSCDITRHTCFNCSTDKDCTAAGLPACDRVSGNCVECLYSSHCAGSSAGLSCDTAAHLCVECSVDSDCTALLTACDVSTHACVACTDNSHCPAGRYCDVASQVCTTCIHDAHCKDTTAPVCMRDSEEGQCVQCLYDTHCTDTTLNICNTTTHMCVECELSAQCWLKHTNRPICDNNACRGCSTGEECEAQFSAYPACEDDTGNCVADAFDKGFYVAGVVLGSIAVFLVIVVLGLLAAGVGKKG